MAGEGDLGPDRVVGGIVLEVVELRGDPRLAGGEVGFEGLELFERGDALARRTGERVNVSLEHVF